MANNKQSPDLIAFAVTGTDDNPFYNKIGAAWKNKKGGYGIKLSALPINGELVLFPPKNDIDKKNIILMIKAAIIAAFL